LGNGWKWHAPKDPASCLSLSLRSRLETYRKQLRQCHKKFTEESVHQLRVATRRLMTQCILLRCVTAGNDAEKARQKLKQRLKTLGALRDTHVQRLFIEAQLRRFPELAAAQSFLHKRELRLARTTASKVRRFQTRKLEKWTLSMCRQLEAQPPTQFGRAL